jgi:biopolymer transport protein ExbB/TolQ
MDVSSGGIAFALKYATLEGKITIAVLLLFSLVSWTVIINKFRQLARARKRTRKFLTVYSKAKGPLYMYNRGPLKDAQLKRYGQKIPNYAMSAVRIAIERALGEAAVSLESGMIVLATAISGGPFVGLLGTVWGVMDTFSGIGRVQQASLTAMAPGVAAALIATVAGLMVAIPSLFCYNYLVTRIRTLTMEMDNFAAHLETVFVSEYLQLSRNGSGPEDPAQQFLTKPKEEAEPTMGAAAGH